MKRIILLLAALLTPFPAAAAAGAPPAFAFMCPQYHVCVFQNTDYTGAVEDIDATNSANWNVWENMAYTGSANVNTSASSVEFWSHATGAHVCVNPQTRVNLHHAYGYLYIDHNTLNCAGVPPGP